MQPRPRSLRRPGLFLSRGVWPIFPPMPLAPPVRPKARPRPPTVLPEEFLRQRERFMGFPRIACGVSANTLEAYGRDLNDLLGDLASSGIRNLNRATARVLAAHMVGLK